MTKRDRTMLLVIAAVAILGGFWMLVISPQRKAAADARAQVDAARSALDAARQKAASGKAAQTAYQRDRASIVKVGRVVPETDDIPTLIIQLQKLANKEHVAFTAWSLASGGGGAAASPSTSSATSSSATPGAAGKAGSGSTAVVAPLYPPGSVQMNGGLGRTPVTIGLAGTYFNLERYLRAVQRFAVLSQKHQRTEGRLVIVDAFSYTPTENKLYDSHGKAMSAGNSTFLEAELTASVYFAPPLQTPGASGSVSAAPPTASSASTSTTGAATVGGLK